MKYTFEYNEYLCGIFKTEHGISKNSVTFPGGIFHIALWKYVSVLLALHLDLIPGVCMYMCVRLCVCVHV